jgi:hypothetical protein
MKRLLIAITLALLALCLLKGAPRSAQDETKKVEADLYRTVDERLGDRLPSLRLGAELSAALADAV